MTANVIYEIVQVHDDVSPSAEPLKAVLDRCEGFEGLGGFLYKFTLAEEVLAHVPNLPDARIASIVKNVSEIRIAFVEAYGSMTAAQYKSNVSGHLELLRGAGDLVAMVSRGQRVAMDRAEVRDQACELIDAVRSCSDLPEPVASALALKLSSAVRLLNGHANYSDDQLRGYIKRVFADLAAEAEAADVTESKTFKNVSAWAIRACAGGAVGIGLIADVPAAYALLEGPAQKLIEHMTE